MKKKTMKKVLSSVVYKWIESVKDEKLQKMLKKNTIVTGGSLVSLLNNEEPNDFDIYFKDKKTTLAVAKYYTKLWNKEHDETKVTVSDRDGRIKMFIESSGIASEEGINDTITENEKNILNVLGMAKENKNVEKYMPRYITSNAISLSGKIQLIIRFYGNIDEIHKNYDYVHCTCSYDNETNEIHLPSRALEAIINKELFYMGSRYPLASIIRSRKFIERGWHINAGQYVKMAMQLNNLDLTNLETLEDQLTGVDTAYFAQLIELMSERMNEEETITVPYIIKLIDRIF